MTDFPVLRYLDVIIGLAVVALLASTIVASVTHIALSYTYSRSRNLRDGLADLISQVDPAKLSQQAAYVAERLLRHPLVARDATLFGKLTSWLRHKISPTRSKLPLPSLNPADTLQREEIVMLLLEWASEDGAMFQQDLELAGAWPEAAKVLADLRQTLRNALRSRGVPDPEASAQAIRLQMIKNEAANPGQAAQVWRAQAVTAAAPTDLVARVNAWYDNSMARIGQAFGMEAKVWACVFAFFVVFAIQLDGVNLLTRLASDDKLRASLVQEAEIQTKQIDDARKQLNDAKSTPADVTQAQQQQADAAQEREKIAASLADLRQPDRAVVPSYFLWQDVAQVTLCVGLVNMPTSVTGTVTVGPTNHTFKADLNPGREGQEIGTAIRNSGASLAVYDEGRCSRLVAATTAPDRIGVTLVGDYLTATPPYPGAQHPYMAWDRFGFWPRIPGMLFMWVLVSLGSPFWYDLLKQLLGLRSMLAAKDDSERQARADAATPAPGTAPAAAPVVPGSAAPAGAGYTGGDERGDLSATGAEG